MVLSVIDFFFFFQAEDGIRDDLVTGVQTCALPIFALRRWVVMSNQRLKAMTARATFVFVDGHGYLGMFSRMPSPFIIEAISVWDWDKPSTLWVVSAIRLLTRGAASPADAAARTSCASARA